VDRERYENMSREGEVCKSFWADPESSRTVSHVSIQDRASAINFDHSLTGLDAIESIGGHDTTTDSRTWSL
jgi:hypothetical protein